MIRQMIAACAIVAAAAVAIGAGTAGGQQVVPAVPAVSATTCAQAHDTVTRLIDGAKKRLEAARQTNGAAALRAAVDDMQSVLVEIGAQLAPCAAAPAAPAHVH